MKLKHSLLILFVLIAAGCGNARDMKDHARLKPYETCPGLEEPANMSAPLEGTVAQGQLRGDGEFYTGKVNGKFTQNIPLELTMEILRDGREEYGVFCAVCHDSLGHGRGIVVEKGFREPKSFNEDYLRTAPPGYFYDVISNGYVTMAGYAKDIPPQDRWAIAAYLRALQISQNASIEDVSVEARGKLTGEAP